MTPVVERVARAIMEATGCGLMRDGQRVFCDHCDCRSAATAAIAAMREPTREMLRPGALAISDIPSMQNRDQAHACWTAMLQAALTGGGDG